MRINLPLLFILVLALHCYSLFAQDMAEEPDKDSLHYQWERFSVNLGFFLTAVNSDVSISGTETGLGVNLNMEDAFGLSTSSFEIRGETSYNFGSNLRSHLRVGYFGLIRNSSKTLEDEISIGDTTFPVGTYLSSRYDLHIIRALYDYAFFQDERFSFSFSGGFYILPVNFSIGTQYIINESAKFIAPLPVIGIRNIFFITPKILLKQNLEVLYVKTSNFRGSITDLNVHVEYNPFKHFGIGAGFNSFNFNFSVSKETGKSWNFDGSIYTGFTGFLLYGRYYF